MHRLSGCCMIRTMMRSDETDEEWWETYQSAEIVPNLTNIRIEADGARVCVKRIAVLIDLVVEYTDGAPESRVTAISVDSLLIGFVRFRVLLL